MNASLKPKTNVVLCIVWLSVVIASWVFATPFQTRLVLIAIVLGILAGYLQSQALGQVAATLKKTETLLDVRRAMMSSTFGKASIWLLWLTVAGLVAWNSQSRTPSETSSLIYGYAAFACARELTALPAVFRLSRNE